MMDWLQRIADVLGASRYAEHSLCLTNDPVMIFLFVTGDIITAASYLTIGLSLMYYRMRVVQFSAVARGLYGAFIFLCGASHFSEVLTMFSGIYRLDVAITTAMAVVSAFTAIVTYDEISRGEEMVVFPASAVRRNGNGTLEIDPGDTGDGGD